MYDLSHKVAVITGAGGGIGAMTAEVLHRCDARIALIGRSEASLGEVARKLRKDTDRVFCCACDVRREDDLLKAKEQVLKKWDRVDILVTCAAAPAVSGKTEEMKYEEWRIIMDTDLDGVFLTCKVFGAEMVRKRSGRIVNLTSFHTTATYPQRAAYGAAKSGVGGLTRALAVEWGSYGITVNAVAPGPVRTPRTSWFLSQSQDAEAGMLGRTPDGRLGETEDVAYTVAFLASDEARHINGQEIAIDGGWTKCAWWGKHEKKY